MIKHFFKVFFASIVLISVILSVTALGYIFIVDKDIAIAAFNNDKSQQTEQLQFYESSTFDYTSEVGEAAKTSKRFNVLVVGLEDSRTDTIIVASYDMENKAADLISIPRDTYYPRDMYDSPELKKINSVYAQEGIEGLVPAVQKILGIPLDKYVIVDYEAVVACVDLLGGVEVNVPFHMVYSDPYDDPPLNIDIPEGNQVLSGEQSLKFLRYRKGYDNQDLGRITAQQQFIKSAIKKAMGLKLPALIQEAYSYIETNVKVTDIMFMATDIVGFSTDNISLTTMPGTETPLEGLSFYLPDEDGIKNVIHNMYGIIGSESQTN
ncbi:MAG: LytR family transcriptional regulator [Sedimentibacter sp.]|nr:LytR family transcriptional regulator [Sedimentibacter sp.]